MKKVYMIFFTLIVTVLLMGLHVHAQTVNLQWARQIGGANDDFSYSVTTDAAGNVYTTGYFFDTADFDPGSGVFNLTSVGDMDIFISKLDVNGNFVWVKQIGGTSTDAGSIIATDAASNVYTIGYFSGTADFDPGSGTHILNSNGNYDVFISKLDSNGSFVWAKQLGGTDREYARSIALDATGHIYITGNFGGTADFDPGNGTYSLASAGSWDVFISKLDNSGNFIWAKRIGGTTQDYNCSISLDTLGSVYTTGSFSGTVDFDPGNGTTNLTSVGGLDIFISKLDSGGNFVWVKQMGGTSDEEGRFIAIDALGNIYTTGPFSGTADFNPGSGSFNLASAGGWDAFISKIDINGNFIWAKQFGGASPDQGHAITLDASSNVYSTGEFAGTADFDPGNGSFNLTSVGDMDVFISKLDSAGNFIWAKQLGGAGYDNCTSILLDPKGNLYTTGWFSGVTDFDPGAGTHYLTPAGGVDAFVHKMGCTKTFGTYTTTACDSFTWINGITYKASNYTAKYVLTNTAGCDSVVTLNLSLTTIDTSVSKSGTTLSSNQTGASYQWLDCNNNYTLVNNATSQSFTATVSSSYAVEIKTNGCTDTSACFNISIIGTIERASHNQISIYPNPNNRSFTIALNQKTNEPVLVKMFDLTGRLVLSAVKTGNELHMQTPNLASGSYLLEVISNNEVKRVRLTINR